MGMMECTLTQHQTDAQVRTGCKGRHVYAVSVTNCAGSDVVPPPLSICLPRIIVFAYQPPQSLQADLMRQMADRSAQCWWQPGHPGFAIAPLDSDRFLASLQGTPGPFAVPLGSPLLATGAARQRPNAARAV